MIRLTELLLTLTSPILAAKLVQNADFLAYLNKQGKSYTDAKEFAMRQQLFMESDAFIKERNA